MDNPYILLFLGLVVLIFAGEVLVRGAVSIALQMRISTLVVGMTVVSFGTSAPELLVSLQAALHDHPGIAIGNVVGSNIANIGLVLGCTALLVPLPVDRNSIRIDWPVMMLATFGFFIFIQNGWFGFWEGVISLSALFIFLFWLVRNSRKQNKIQRETEAPVFNWRNIIRDIAFIILGCLGLVQGADWLVDGAATIAKDFGVSDHVIGVTIIAFGTSVPELITSIMAALKRQMDISIGNLIGSNLFNILAILGTTSIVTDIEVDSRVISVDVFWMLGIAALLLPIMLMGKKVKRWEGGVLLGIYVAYIIFQTT